MSNLFGKPQIIGMVLLAGLFLTFSGCGSGRPDTFQVTGTVIYKGKPLEGATVNFFPKGTRPANGTTDAQGRFTLLSFSPDDGAVAGEHVVCVSKYSHSSDPKHPSIPTMKLLVPQIYTSQLTSPLRAMVTKDGPNDFRLELKD